MITTMKRKIIAYFFVLSSLLACSQHYCMFYPSHALTQPDTVTVSYKVSRVIDGDTFIILWHSHPQRVRLLGVDTPETVHPYKPVECFGPQASVYTHRMLTNHRVYLEFDPTQPLYDTYHRLLAYVWLDKHFLLNEQLLGLGYAREYTYFHHNYTYKKDFVHQQLIAKLHHRGLWSACSS